MTITIDDFVRREVLYRANLLIMDLRRIVSELPYSVLKDTSIDDEALRNLSEITDWQEPVERFVAELKRDNLIELLDAAGVEDDRPDAEILAAAAHEITGPNHADVEDVADLLDQWPGIPNDDLRAKLLAAVAEAEEWEEFGRNNVVREVEPDRSEVYEHYIVTDWLAAKLKEKGHPVEDICDFTIWGRPTTGQMISMDGVIQEIYREWQA